jgi:hypothetical protein
LDKPVVTYRSSAKISRRMSEALGSICTHFAMLEWNVDRTIWALLGADRKKGRVLTQHLLNKQRIKRLRKEVVARFGDKSTSGRYYKKLADHIGRMVEFRNLYVHGIWSKGKAPGTRRKQYVLSYFSNPNGDAEGVDLPTLRAFVQMIALTTAALETAAIKHLGAPLP